MLKLDSYYSRREAVMGLLFDRIIFNAIFVVGLFGILYIFIKRGTKKMNRLRDEYLEEDMEANNARKRDVEAEYYFEPDISEIPFQEAPSADIKRKQEHVIYSSKRKMLRFPEKMSNIDLKFAYGAANLELIAGYEENYYRFISSLISLADALLAEGIRADAVRIFEYTVELRSEYRKSYLPLADYYAENNNAAKLDFLMDRISEVFTDEGIKKSVLKYIMDKKEDIA